MTVIIHANGPVGPIKVYQSMDKQPRAYLRPHASGGGFWVERVESDKRSAFIRSLRGKYPNLSTKRLTEEKQEDILLED